MFHDLEVYFYENVVKSYREYAKMKATRTTGSDQDLRLAISAATALYHLREHLPQSVQKSRAQLTQICPDYGLLGDIVNAAKHKELTRGTPLLSAASALSEAVLITEYQDEQGPYRHSEKQVIVKLIDGSERILNEILTNVINMWLVEMHALGIIKYHDPFIADDKIIPTRETSNEAYLDIEAIHGLPLTHSVRIRRYNHETGNTEPINIVKASMKIYEPKVDLVLKLKLSDSTELEKAVTLSDDDTQEYLKLKSELEREAFIQRLARKLQIINQTIDEHNKRPLTGTTNKDGR